MVLKGSFGIDISSKVPSTSLHKSGVSSAFIVPATNDEIEIVNPKENILNVLMKFLLEIDIFKR